MPSTCAPPAGCGSSWPRTRPSATSSCSVPTRPAAIRASTRPSPDTTPSRRSCGSRGTSCARSPRRGDDCSGCARKGPMSDCLFCKICEGSIPATITYRDADVVAFKDIGPKAPFHQLVIPIRHIASLTEATPEDAALLGKLMVVASRLAAEAGVAGSGFRVVMNAGPDAGQTVPHVHLHALAGRELGWPPG